MHLYDVWSSETELYLVLEYIEGGELFDYLCSKGQRLHLLEAVSIIKQVCSTDRKPTERSPYLIGPVWSGLLSSV
jgi:serine/threonine protein kinase